MSFAKNLFQSRTERYRQRAARMSDTEISRAYVDLAGKVEVLSKLSREFTYAFSGADLPREYLPRYSGLNRHFEADENEAHYLLKKARIWVAVLEEAIAQRNIDTDNMTIAMPGRPRLRDKRIDFTPYTAAFPR